MKVDEKQRYLMVAEAAYFRAQQRHFAPGHEHEDWLAAERQVDEMLKNLKEVPMQSELQASAATNPAARQRRTSAAATETTPGAAEAVGADQAKPARSRRSKTAASTETTTAKPRTRRTAAKAQAPLENPDFMADMVTGTGSGEAALQTGMGDAGIGLGADENPSSYAGAGATGTASVTGAGSEAESKPKRGRRTKAAAPETSATATTKRPGRPRKTLH